jgi:hypothetical protein
VVALELELVTAILLLVMMCTWAVLVGTEEADAVKFTVKRMR